MPTVLRSDSRQTLIVALPAMLRVFPLLIALQRRAQVSPLCSRRAETSRLAGWAAVARWTWPHDLCPILPPGRLISSKLGCALTRLRSSSFRALMCLGSMSLCKVSTARPGTLVAPLLRLQTVPNYEGTLLKPPLRSSDGKPWKVPCRRALSPMGRASRHACFGLPGPPPLGSASADGEVGTAPAVRRRHCVSAVDTAPTSRR